MLPRISCKRPWRMKRWSVITSYSIHYTKLYEDAYKVTDMKTVDAFSTASKECTAKCNPDCTKKDCPDCKAKTEACKVSCANKTEAEKMACAKDGP